MVFASGVSKDCIVAGCTELAVAGGLCRSHYDRRAYSGRPVAPIRSRVCPMCGMAFQLIRASKRFCSATCRKRYQRRCAKQSVPPFGTDSNPIIESEPVTPKPVRSMTYGAFTEADIWAKCDGTCYGCGEAVVKDVDSPDAGTPGWIVPPEDGGEPSFENRAIFHYRCVRRHV
ncbi:hypothetical protein [Bifidobacterium olomucense]|uniref:Uncharacterized protein n=1 Tax=Bifidobacterium olomucense TaxID=2675324 RepID=A0A7Y0EXE8_9BIFI|nr:hypothetical protein [Bifidobacterium sp. DSM 109959]NMM98144.1 hypothetical protein [Bifidobacterium sp. DSM 109959]